MHGLGHHHEDEEHTAAALARGEAAIAELEQMRRSPAWGLAQDIEADIEAAVANPEVAITELADEVEASFQRRRAERLSQRARPLVKAAVDEALAAEEGAIDKEAQRLADAAAAEAVEDFRAKRAGPYRDSETGRRTRATVAAAVLHEMDDDGAGGTAGEPVAHETRDQLKARAAALRAETSGSNGTGILPYSKLHRGDVLTLFFTEHGRGNQSHGSSGYDSGYRYGAGQASVRRRLTVELLDPARGSFQVQHDSWLEGEHPSEHGIRPGRHVSVLACDPDAESPEPEPMLVKAAPVVLEAIEGRKIDPMDFDLWYVHLGEYKALS